MADFMPLPSHSIEASEAVQEEAVEAGAENAVQDCKLAGGKRTNTGGELKQVERLEGELETSPQLILGGFTELLRR
jgi:hypothetical protein